MRWTSSLLWVLVSGCGQPPEETDTQMMACLVFRCDNPNPTICACPDDKETGGYASTTGEGATSTGGVDSSSGSPVVDSSTGPGVISTSTGPTATDATTGEPDPTDDGSTTGSASSSGGSSSGTTGTTGTGGTGASSSSTGGL